MFLRFLLAQLGNRQASLVSGDLMVPNLLFIFVPLALLVMAGILVFVWDKIDRRKLMSQVGNGDSEGAFRAFFHALWLLLLWSCLCFSLPLWFSFRARVGELAIGLRWVLILKILVFPTVFLALLWFGKKRGYLKWIQSLDWPDKENQ